jgi:asparagine synthase (glutamine-hydrolysing)
MCGIAGFIDPNTPTDERLSAVRGMCDAMVHRGPDDQGIAAQGPAVIGSRRLAIFDPANGHQPMRTPDGRYTLVLNGAIYNFRELEEELARAGWTFRTNCDTEALLAAFAHWGPSCVSRLRGMFAFAVWDGREQALHLARDAFGVKPLYYRHDGSRLLFASEIKALRASGAFALEVEPAAVSDYLAWLAVPAPRTLFRGVFSLRPGEQAVFKGGRLDIRSWWSFRTIPHDSGRRASRGAFVRELRERLEDSIRSHVLADVPVGAFLSGGLDSAVIAGLMGRAMGGRLRTFTLGFGEEGCSEAAEAEATARHLGTEHQTRILTGSEVADGIERFLDACDQPTGDGINTYHVSQTARAGGVTAALSGLGGDELFGGYPSFRQIRRLDFWIGKWRLLPAGIRRGLCDRMDRGGPAGQKLADILRNARDAHEIASLQRRVFGDARRRSLLSRDALAALADTRPFHPELAAMRADLPDAGPADAASAWELRTYMADVLLRDSDVMSMSHSLELRVPFVDRPFVEWLWRQPPEWRITPRRPKSALADAAADLLPPGMRSREKRGFSLPMALWMRRELRPFLDETFSDSSIARSGLFEAAAVRDSWRRFREGGDGRDWSRVWSLAVLIAIVNRRTPPAPAPSPAPPGTVRRTQGARSPSVPIHEDAPARAVPARHKVSTLVMAPEVFASHGGIARAVHLYLKALCDDGIESDRGVKLISLNDSALDSRDVRRYTGGTLDDWFVCAGRKLRFVRESFRMVRGCDRVVCGHVAQLPVAWLLSLLHPRLRTYVIAHGIEVWRPFTFLERRALRGAARIFCVSDFTRRNMEAYYRPRAGQAVVLPNAIDPAFAIEPGIRLADCPPVIVTVARLLFADRYKGVEHLISAMPRVRAEAPGAQLRVVGSGDDLPRLQSVARNLGILGNGVEFLGRLDDKSLARELRGCRLFALPSGREGFGIVYLEAMAHGRPCLAARAGGAPEVITEDTGVLVEFANVPAIAAGCVAALKRDWKEPDILARAGHFSFEAFKERLAPLFAP